MHSDKRHWNNFLDAPAGQLPMWMATEAMKKIPALLSPWGGIFKNPTIKQVAKTSTSRHETFVSNELNWKCIIGFRIASFPSQDEWENHNYLPTWSYHLKVKATQNCWSHKCQIRIYSAFLVASCEVHVGRTGWGSRRETFQTWLHDSFDHCETIVLRGAIRASKIPQSNPYLPWRKMVT